MTAEQLAKIHAACFDMPRPWNVAEFADFLANPLIFLIQSKNGFALGRIVGPEAELLTIAVLPNAQNLGEGRILLQKFIDSAAISSVQEIFLEVAQTNAAAINLYKSVGFERIAKRAGYYQDKSGDNVAAIVMKYAIFS